jgi:hypothetical protein
MTGPGVVRKPDGLRAHGPGFLRGRIAVQPLMHAQAVIVPSIELKLTFQIGDVPKEQMIQVFPAEGPDEPFDKRMAQARQLHPIVVIGHKSFVSPTPIIRYAVRSSNWCAGGTVGEIIESGFIMTADS